MCIDRSAGHCRQVGASESAVRQVSTADLLDDEDATVFDSEVLMYAVPAAQGIVGELEFKWVARCAPRGLIVVVVCVVGLLRVMCVLTCCRITGWYCCCAAASHSRVYTWQEADTLACLRAGPTRIRKESTGA